MNKVELEVQLRVAAAIADVPIALLIAFEGGSVRVFAHQSDIEAPELAKIAAPARRFLTDTPRLVPRVGRGPAAPEVASFPASVQPLAVFTFPLCDLTGAQNGALVLADVRARDPLTDRSIAALLDVCGMLENATRALPSSRAATRSIVPRNTVDRVTGLPDRSSLEAETERMLERAEALTAPLSLAIVSLDRFRRVNDSLGHIVGDHLLRQVAQRLLATVGEGDLVGRRTGDEFIVVSGDLPYSGAALPLADRLQQAVREPFHVDGHEIALTATVGLALFPEDASDVASLLRCADIAVHAAKNEGHGKLRAFQRTLETEANERLQLEDLLRRALREGQLAMHYQPKFAIEGRRLVGSEALMRWTHPERGFISPGRFIPLAEETGLIVPMGTWALSEVCRQQRAFLDQGVDVGRASVNVSGLQFVRHDFVGTVKRALKAYSLPPQALELEITETVLMGDVDRAVSRLSELRELGLRISIDDFGTGYSSLAYLQKLPADVLKIDRSFVMDLDSESVRGEQARSLVQAITYLGHQLGLVVLAEGVETEAQLEHLGNAGCDEVQGYLLGKPAPAESLPSHVN